MGESGINVTIDEFNPKLISLRVYYSGTQNRVENSSRKSGSGTSEVFKVKMAITQNAIFLQ